MFSFRMLLTIVAPIQFVHTSGRSRDSVVGIATGYGLENRGIGVWIPVGSRIFSSPCRPDWLWGPPNPMDTVGVKRPGSEADNSTLTSAEVKKIWISIHPLPHTLN
jgi:hypothetical protein